MCIIIVKPAGEDIPADHILQNCFKNNPDGAGLMFQEKKKKVLIEKGFMTVDSLLYHLEKIDRKYTLSDRDVCIHFRQATHGVISPGNTHPFPVTNNVKELQKTHITTSAGLAHNGILYRYSPPKGSHLSDTMVFVRAISERYDEKKDLMMMNGSGQRFCMMTRDRTLICGEYLYEDGMYFSNSSFRW